MKSVVALTLCGSIAALSGQSVVMAVPDADSFRRQDVPVTLCATGRTLWLTLPAEPHPYKPPHDGPMPCHATCVLRSSEDDLPQTP